MNLGAQGGPATHESDPQQLARDFGWITAWKPRRPPGHGAQRGQPVTPELMPRPQPTDGQSGLAARTRPASACQSKTPALCMGFSKTQSLITTRYLKHPGYNPQLPNIYRTGKVHLTREGTAEAEKPPENFVAGRGVALTTSIH